MSRRASVALLILAALFVLSCAHLDSAKCISRAVADALECMPSAAASAPSRAARAPRQGQTEIERLLCEAARRDGTKGWEKVCPPENETQK